MALAPESADVAFVGGVMSIEETGGGVWHRVRFRVARPLRGPVGDVVVIETTPGEGSCGYRFEEGHEYRVYASIDDDGTVRTSSLNPIEHLGVASYARDPLSVPVSIQIGLLVAGSMIGAGTMLRRRARRA